MHYIRLVAIAALVGLSAGIFGGCAGTGEAKKEAESAQPQSQPQDAVSPEARQKYDEALKAMRNGDADKAKDMLLALSEAHPDLSGPYTNLGLIYFRQGDTDKAEAAFLQAIKVNPKSAVSYNHLGIISRGKGKFQEAEAQYQQALKIDDNYAYAHLNIGILYDLYLGQLDKALAHYQKFQKLSPEKDPEVEKWIVDLQRRIKSGN
ncbi:MAG: tetratricopeptide repeat protein [Gammaproteobacteria bacterium]|jgi:tetratricopeptide (TPR) repeat protein|nr:tetratricopeptide repeat protein [Gammaproteobacteria bacterium]